MSIRPEQPEPFLRGCVFPAVADAPYPRADPAGAEYLPADVWAAAQLPVGVRLELQGNARTIRVWYETTRASLGYRGESAGCSFVAYRGGQKVASDDAVMGDGMAELVMSGRTDLPVTIYLPEGMAPLINGVAGVEEAMVPAPLQPRWLAYGDAVTQGWLASAPAMAWPAVAGRKLGLDVCNFGYAGSARGETTSALLLAETPAEVISVAFGLNNWSRVPHTAGLMAEEVRCFLSLVRRSHPEVPIVVVSPTARPDAEETPNRVGATLSELRMALEETVRQCITDGDGMLFLVEGLSVVEPEHLEDGIYPGDEGHRRLAAAVSKILLPHLAELQEAAEKRWANEGVPHALHSQLRADGARWVDSAGAVSALGGVAAMDVGADIFSHDLAPPLDPPDILPDGRLLDELDELDEFDDLDEEAPMRALLDEPLLDESLQDEGPVDDGPPDRSLDDGLSPDEVWQDEVWPDEVAEDVSRVLGLESEEGTESEVEFESEMDFESVANFWSVDESWVDADSDDGGPADEVWADEVWADEVSVDEVAVDELAMGIDLPEMESPGLVSLSEASLSETSLNEDLLEVLSSNGEASATPELASLEIGSVYDGPADVETPRGARPDIATLYNEQLEFTSLFEDPPETGTPEIAMSNGSGNPDGSRFIDAGGPSAENAPLDEEVVPNMTPAESSSKGTAKGSAAKGTAAKGPSAKGSSAKGMSSAKATEAKGASAAGTSDKATSVTGSAKGGSGNGTAPSESPADVRSAARREADARKPRTATKGAGGAPVDIAIADMVVAALSLATNGADDVIIRDPAGGDELEWAEAVDPSS